MKKVFAVLTLTLLTFFSAHAQGQFLVNNLSAPISTNATSGGAASGRIAGVGGYVFAIFYSTNATSVNGQTAAIVGNASASYAFNDSAWKFAAYGTNTAAAGRLLSASPNASGYTVAPDVAEGSNCQFVVVGWSASIGTTVAAVQSWFNGGSVFPNPGWIGQSAVSGSRLLGGGGYPQPQIFGSASPLIPSFTLGMISEPNYYGVYLLSQPSSQTVVAGNNATFSCTADGLPLPTYQWRFNGTNILGAVNPSLTITNVQIADAGSYSVLVANFLGSAISSNAVLTIQAAGTPPVIVNQPASVALPPGSNASFTVTASGTGPLSFQWSLNGTNLVNATNATLALNNVQPVNAGNYAAAIFNPYGSTNSATAVLTVQTYPPFINAQPQSVSAPLGGSATFTVAATGTGVLNYQWTLNGTNLPNATSSSLTITSVQTNSVGNYAVSIANLYGSTNSATAALTLQNSAPIITSQPQNVSVPERGYNPTFGVAVVGTPPFSYQWSFNGTNLPNETNWTFMVNNAQLSDAGNYAVTISNPYGITNSANAVLTVTPRTDYGYVIFTSFSVASSPSSSKMFTNAVVGGPPTGLTASNALGFRYALYASTNATTVNGISNAIVGAANTNYVFNDPAWILAAYGTNALIPGRMRSAQANGSGYTIVPIVGGAVLPARFVLVGWLGIGTNIAAVQTWFNNGHPATDGWIGQSPVSGQLVMGDGSSFPPPSVFLSTTNHLQGVTMGLASPNPAANYPPPAVPPPVLTTKVVGNLLKLSWTVAYGSYGVQSCSQLGGTWEDVAGTPTSDGTNWNLNVLLATQQPYYRLIVLQ